MLKRYLVDEIYFGPHFYVSTPITDYLFDDNLCRFIAKFSYRTLQSEKTIRIYDNLKLVKSRWFQKLEGDKLKDRTRRVVSIKLMKHQLTVSNKKSNKQNNDQTTVTLSSVELENMIKNAVERELLRHGVDRNLNNSRSEAVQANIKNKQPNNRWCWSYLTISVYRDTHFIASHGNNDRLRSREHIGTDPAALAPQTRTGPDYADCQEYIAISIVQTDRFHCPRFSKLR